MPERILFADGHEILYTYAVDGRKLRAEYLLNNIAIIDADKAESGEVSTFALDDAITAPGIGELPAEPAVTTLMVRDYCGEHIHLNGKLELTLTPNGYIQDGEPYFYIKDYQGNVRAVLNQQNQPVELTGYYPYGGIMAATATEDVQPYKYGTKELDRQNGLDLYDSQARFYDSLLGRTPTQDPMVEKYPHLSPYLWCAANPIRFTDPSGMVIEGKSLSEWNILRNAIEREMNKLQSDIDKLNLKAKSKGWSANKLASKIGNRTARVSNISSSLEIMDILEKSNQVYSLAHLSGSGSLSFDVETKIISINYEGTANFIHELIHAGQFETGDIAFIGSNICLQDVYDEVLAYKSQFAYSPYTVSSLVSSYSPKNIEEITPLWVQGLIDDKGTSCYAPGGRNNTGIIPVNINATRDDLIRAYPWNAGCFQTLPTNFIVRAMPGLYYKR